MSTSLYPKFRNKNGTLTRYAFACGYLEERERRDDDRAVLTLDGCWHVKGFKDGEHFWECFDTMTEARKFFDNLWADNN